MKPGRPAMNVSRRGKGRQGVHTRTTSRKERFCNALAPNVFATGYAVRNGIAEST